ncbi:MAG: tRNA pseudouridine(55) synthase TruB [Pseudomonadota bacterium]
MARKRKGRPIHGWLIIDKPKGVTSTAVVNKVRWALQAQKAGHGGTLDPLATGMLAIALGEATKTVSIAQECLKTYRFTVRLGQQTTTDDAEGKIITTSDLRPSDADIEAALPSFTGDIEQVPPQFSAVKVEGERAYDLARDGVDLDLAPRPLYVEKLALIERPDPDHVELELVCGKGGYVRSIARDLGEVLGCHGHVARLHRVSSGGFTLDNAVNFEDLNEEFRSSDSLPPLLPLEAGLKDLPEVAVKPEQAVRLRNGNPTQITFSDLNYGDQAWASVDGNAVALVMYKAGMLHPSRVFMVD